MNEKKYNLIDWPTAINQIKTQLAINGKVVAITLAASYQRNYGFDLQKLLREAGVKD